MDVGQSLRVSWCWVSVVPTAGCNGPCLVNKQRAVKSGRQRLMPCQSNWSSGLIEPQHGSVSSALSAIVVHRFLSPSPPPPLPLHPNQPSAPPQQPDAPLLLIFRPQPPPFRVQELCESQGGRPVFPVLMSLMVSVDVKQH